MIAFLACVAIVLGAIIVVVVSRARYLARLGADGPAPESIHDPLLLSLLSVILLAGPGMGVLALLPPVQSLFRDLACPSGWHIVGTSVSGFSSRTHYGAACQQGTQLAALSVLYRVACAALVAAIAATVGLALMGRKWMAVRQRQRWGG